MRRVSQIRTEPAPGCEIELVRSHVGESGTAVRRDVIVALWPWLKLRFLLAGRSQKRGLAEPYFQ